VFFFFACAARRFIFCPRKGAFFFALTARGAGDAPVGAFFPFRADRAGLGGCACRRTKGLSVRPLDTFGAPVGRFLSFFALIARGWGDAPAGAPKGFPLAL